MTIYALPGQTLMTIVEGGLDPAKAGITAEHILMTGQRPDDAPDGKHYVADASGSWVLADKPLPSNEI